MQNCKHILIKFQKYDFKIDNIFNNIEPHAPVTCQQPKNVHIAVI